ncbi:TPA: aromatic acid exporter family protein [Streptococcus suis]
MEWPIKIGWRTIKTVIAVFITLLLYHWLNRQPANLAALACVFTMQGNVPASIEFGRYRILGNTIGAVIAGATAYLELTFGFFNPYVHIFATTLGILLVIVTCNLFKIPKSIVNSAATYFVVLLTISTHQIWAYTINRVLDVIVGVTIAILVNRILPGPYPSKENQAPSLEGSNN